ncbi:FtsK/SpoIIIE domain-containing protein [Bradyrhizobium sp. CIAT3101]|uniref:FtsK/SpoIIIE domain-containing protein n=1 Tax=Bradyrhizobium sp. CIAT3101 TaxID=439387 RepID=UPI0024B26AE2|nr:FtsK/SpoIIIE domain-containing protein [Bradyrhizobium sp. CIAT3101]WFU79395.1 FtsK/SpoIIIE domain-containing protein [Bradyrhizobium sp. CIAT3101]
MKERDGKEIIGFVAVAPALVAAIGGLAVAGPIGAVAAAVATWAGTYTYLEPRTRPPQKLLPSPQTYSLLAAAVPPRSAPPALTDAEFRQQHGAPQVFWSAADFPKTEFGNYYGPITWVHPTGGEQITWSFFQAIGHATTSLVRLSGGESFNRTTAQRVCDAVQMIAARKFQLDATEAFNRGGGMARYYRELEAKQRADKRAAIEVREAAEKKQKEEEQVERERLATEKRQHEVWLRELRDDRDRVVVEIKQGREAQLKFWCLKPGFTEQRTGLEERQKVLNDIKVQIAGELAKIDTYRQQIAERAAQEAKWKAEREESDARMARLKGQINLVMRDDGRIILGTCVDDGRDGIWRPSELRHMLVAGMTGSGKSVFLQQLAYQLLRSPDVDRVVLIDLKGGTEFYQYVDEPKARVAWELSDAIKMFDELMAYLDVRLAEMRLKGLRDWDGPRTFIIIDEYAEIQELIHDAKRGEAKEAAQRMASNIRSLVRRSRSAGIVLICALQKPTADAIDPTLRNNMDMRVCFRVKTRFAVEAALDAVLDEDEELPVNPLKLRTGRFLLDAGHGRYLHFQAQIAPDVVLERK